MRYTLLLLFFVSILLPASSQARVGVGVGTGKIELNEVLLPGKSYELPQLTVINTGDEISDYSVGVSYHEQQPEMMPPREWFYFSPDKFNLEPGQSQPVSIKLSIPVKADPGRYFAYVEGFPVVSDSSETRVNIAAATKLTFEVGTSGILSAWYHNITSFWNDNHWLNWVLGVIVLVLIVMIFRRFFKIQVKFNE